MALTHLHLALLAHLVIWLFSMLPRLPIRLALSIKAPPNYFLSWPYCWYPWCGNPKSRIDSLAQVPACRTNVLPRTLARAYRTCTVH